MAEPAPEKLRYGLLAAFYGPLLTQRQRTVVELYCDEDLSAGEIGAQLGISRQGVHDSLLSAYRKLEEAEQRLGHKARLEAAGGALKRVKALLMEAAARFPEAEQIGEALRILDEQLHREGE